MPTRSWAPSRTSTSGFSTTRRACRASTDTTISSTRISTAASCTGTATCATRSATRRRLRNIGRVRRRQHPAWQSRDVECSASGSITARRFRPSRTSSTTMGNPTGKTFPRADFFTWTSVSPRLGLNLKLTGDGKTVVKAHWGRYHPQITTGEFANIIGPNVKPYYHGDLQPRDRPDRGSVPDEQQREPERCSRLRPSSDRSVHRRVRAGAEHEDGPAGQLRAQMGTRLRLVVSTPWAPTFRCRSSTTRDRSPPVARSTSSG